jgi:hypothetical protein
MRLDLRMKRIDTRRNSKNIITQPAVTPAKAPFDSCEWSVEVMPLRLDTVLSEVEVLKLGISFRVSASQHQIEKRK